ncbi:Do family serine endopeptidase [Gilvimarinus sp. F26214L]|uniref:Do family serine endopeptidase n=1 Tax=Gilvimarinus sp. DZF01 TaxID=3461371 RepID=UPI004046569D
MTLKRWLLACILLPLSITASHAALPSHDSEGRELPSLAPMLESVNPAVVNIATYSHQQTYNPLLNDSFFRHFFNIPDDRYRRGPQRRQQSAGSGVIVDAGEGVVLTNYHVIKDADEVQVSLVDGRIFQAEVRGVDAELDIAVLEIDGKNLTAAKLANSNHLRVGDFVVAIGNPFGLGQTVTTGVVSALGRTGLGIEGYENFIQTDASINPGNSGGALVNLNGELIGINTAIIAPAGGNVGIGFAIPINMAKSSMAQILRDGKVKRGTIDISVQDITPDLRQAFSLPLGQHGILVTDVKSGSSAGRAGVKVGDVIVSIAGERTQSVAQWRSQLAVRGIGQDVELGILRGGKVHKVKVDVVAPEQLVVEDARIHPLLVGARFEDSPNGDGVLVAGLAPNSRAAYSGLRPGDMIYGANRVRVSDIESLVRAVQRNRREILLQIRRGGNSFYLVVR